MRFDHIYQEEILKWQIISRFLKNFQCRLLVILSMDHKILKQDGCQCAWKILDFLIFVIVQ